MPSTKSLLVGGVAAVILAAAPSARAAEAVYGGTTSDGEPIVLTAGSDLQSLASAVVGWSAKCDDGSRFSNATALSAATATPGFSPGYHDLLMSRNAKGRFAGKQLGGGGNETVAMAMVIDLAGKLGPARASGTLHAVAKLVDRATGASAGSCDTGTLRYSASRTPGTIYGGRTSQDEPMVVRVDPKRRVVADVLASWHTSTCTPDSLFRFPDSFSGFPLKSTGRFGDAFTADYPMDGGGKRHFGYTLAGRVTSKAVKGTLKVTFSDADPAGAQTRACDSGGITFKALTG
jgi:hypothetical protein